MAYEVGDKIWWRGDEVTISSEPYELYGAQWQDGISEHGKRVTVPTPEQREASAQRARSEWQTQQAGFRRLRGK